MSLVRLDKTAVQDRSEFVSRVYTLLGVSLLFCSAGSYLGLSMPPSLYLPMIVVYFVTYFAATLCQRTYPLNIMLLFLFTIFSGVILGPVLNAYVRMGMGDLIPVAAGTTAVTFGGLSLFVNVTKKDFSFLRGFLFIGLLALVLVGVLGLFFTLPISDLVYSGVGIVIFSGYILLQTSDMVNRYDNNSVVAATLGLYLSIINLFLMVLRFMAAGRRR